MKGHGIVPQMLCAIDTVQRAFNSTDRVIIIGPSQHYSTEIAMSAGASEVSAIAHTGSPAAAVPALFVPRARSSDPSDILFSSESGADSDDEAEDALDDGGADESKQGDVEEDPILDKNLIDTESVRRDVWPRLLFCKESQRVTNLRANLRKRSVKAGKKELASLSELCKERQIARYTLVGREEKEEALIAYFLKRPDELVPGSKETENLTIDKADMKLTELEEIEQLMEPDEVVDAETHIHSAPYRSYVLRAMAAAQVAKWVPPSYRFQFLRCLYDTHEVIAAAQLFAVVEKRQMQEDLEEKARQGKGAPSAVNRRGPNCLLRLGQIGFHDKMAALMQSSGLQPTRDELDAGEIGPNGSAWNQMAIYYKDPDFDIGPIAIDTSVGASSKDARPVVEMEKVDLTVIAQPDITGAKCRDHWKELMKYYNAAKIKFDVSGAHQPWVWPYCDGNINAYYVL